ncbi:MAG: 1-aminocyclopropane-1-carboxylate deaminase/D-cysteine desulfhydrase, partial [Chloroflexota bacterium]
MGTDALYMKRDDLTATVYGGNKPRKLEFILADALRSRVTHVMAFGAAGSNHALATAIYAQQLGLKSISLLMHQPNASYVRRNLLMSYRCGAELHSYGAALESRMNKPLIYEVTLRQIIRHTIIDGRMPYRIAPGGSSLLGIAGYVNAGLELAGQVAIGILPAPDLIYVACGTLGTAAGLLLGLRAAGLQGRVIAVKVTTGRHVNTANMQKSVQSSNCFLHDLDPSFPLFQFSGDESEVAEGYSGLGYALFTDAGTSAVRMMKQHEGLLLDGTYTGKALAALIDDAQAGLLESKTVLFWNTFNSRDFSRAISDVDYHQLP